MGICSVFKLNIVKWLKTTLLCTVIVKTWNLIITAVITSHFSVQLERTMLYHIFAQSLQRHNSQSNVQAHCKHLILGTNDPMCS